MGPEYRAVLDKLSGPTSPGRAVLDERFRSAPLAGPASWVTGEVLYVDGDFLAAGLPVLAGMDAVNGVPAPAAPGAR